MMCEISKYGRCRVKPLEKRNNAERADAYQRTLAQGYGLKYDALARYIRLLHWRTLEVSSTFLLSEIIRRRGERQTTCSPTLPTAPFSSRRFEPAGPIFRGSRHEEIPCKPFNDEDWIPACFHLLRCLRMLWHLGIS